MFGSSFGLIIEERKMRGQNRAKLDKRFNREVGRLVARQGLTRFEAVIAVREKARLEAVARRERKIEAEKWISRAEKKRCEFAALERKSAE